LKIERTFALRIAQSLKVSRNVCNFI